MNTISKTRTLKYDDSKMLLASLENNFSKQLPIWQFLMWFDNYVVDIKSMLIVLRNL